MQRALNFLNEHHIGDLASVLGVVIAILGFTFTIRNSIRSRRAAEEANQAVSIVKTRLAEVNTVADLSAAIAILDEIKRLHREKAWVILPDRYSHLKKVLISSKTLCENITDDQRALIQKAINQSTNNEKQIERALAEADGAINLDIPKMNKILSIQIENLTELILSIQNQIEG